MVSKRCGMGEKKATHFPLPLNVSTGALCAHVILCVGELGSEPTQDRNEQNVCI